MSCTATRQANTVGTMAKRADVDHHRVSYFIRSRGIKPVMRAGIQRIFSDADADWIVDELRRIDADRKEAAQ
jgi:DNA-binding transcriptional MerR regulator